MPSQLVILPILLPLLAAVVNLLLHRSKPVQATTNLVAMTLSLASAIWIVITIYNGPDLPAGVMTSQMGNWPAPFGITVAADMFAALLLCVAGAVAIGVYLYALSQTPVRFQGGYFHTLFPLLLLGVNWAFLAGDLFNLFVSFEVMLLASYSLMTVGTTHRQLTQAYKYVLLNLMVSAVFVASCGWLYGNLGTLNFAELTHLARSGQVDSRAAVAVAALAFVFATKAATFPLWYWLADTYPTLPPALGGMYAGLLTKVGVYSLVRLLVMVFGAAPMVTDAMVPLLLACAGATMFIGVLGAVSSRSVRGMLSILVMSQGGYLILGVALGVSAVSTGGGAPSLVATTATIHYMMQHMVVNCALFLCCGMMEKYAGTDNLDRFGALLSRDRWLATLFLLAALSLVGLPPLSGFFGKFLLIGESFRRADGWGITLGLIAVLTGALTLLAMAKVWCYAFWSNAPAGSMSALHPAAYRPPSRGRGLLAITALVVVALSMGLFAQVYFNFARAAARSLVEPGTYIEAVLGDSVQVAPVEATFDARRRTP